MGEPIIVGGEAPRSNRRALIMLGVAVGLLLVVFVIPKVLFGGGGGDDGTGTGTDGGTALPPGATPSVPEGEEPPETFEVFSSKNPFEPLVEIAASSGDGEGEAAGEDGATTSTVPVDDGFTDDTGDDFTANDDFVDDFPEDGSDSSTDSTVPGDSTDPGGSDTSTTTTTTAPPRYPDRVQLLEVFQDPGGQVVASVRVNDTTYQVAEGDDFATSYRVLDLDIGTRCAELLFGDDRFGICEGQEVLKQR